MLCKYKLYQSEVKRSQVSSLYGGVNFHGNTGNLFKMSTFSINFDLKDNK
jgi:hypothetical protein